MKKMVIITLGIFGLMKMTSAQRNENIFKHTVGDYEVYLLSEGQQIGNSGILIDLSEDIKKETIPDGTFPSAVNAFLIRTPQKNILIDAGLGKKLLENLASLNIRPEQIDIVMITHLHGDHYSGMINQKKTVFSNAEIFIPLQEFEYWMNHDIINSQPENRRGGFQKVHDFIDIYKNQYHLFHPCKFENLERSLYSGIYGIEAYGHTPGHTVYLIESKDEKLLIWGDLTHAMNVQMPYPQIAVTYDVNPEEAVISRKKILEYTALQHIPIAGMHISFPAMGFVEKLNLRTKGYRFIPFSDEK